jgi:hypothetical protein
VFQEETAPKHRSSQSPDLSPIELLWEEVDRQVKERKPGNVHSLEATVKEVWENISPSIIDKLVKRLPRLCQAVIMAEGGYFDESLCSISKDFVYH